MLLVVRGVDSELDMTCLIFDDLSCKLKVLFPGVYSLVPSLLFEGMKVVSYSLNHFILGF